MESMDAACTIQCKVLKKRERPGAEEAVVFLPLAGMGAETREILGFGCCLAIAYPSVNQSVILALVLQYLPMGSIAFELIYSKS